MTTKEYSNKLVKCFREDCHSMRTHAHLFCSTSCDKLYEEKIRKDYYVKQKKH